MLVLLALLHAGNSVSCGVGQFLTPPFTLCEPCPPGKFKPTEDMGFSRSVCIACPRHTYSKHGWGYCKRLKNGKEAFFGCAPGWRLTNGALRLLVEHGKLSKCAGCPAGKFGAGGVSTRCTACQAGRARAGPRPGLCEACSRGRVAPIEGLSECKFCPRGKTALTPRKRGGQFCTRCAAGKSWVGEKPVKYGRPDLGQCAKCHAGRHAQHRGAVKCELCQTGRFSDAKGYILCFGCPPGKHGPYPGETKCHRCSPGRFQRYHNEKHCRSCRAGTYMPEYAAALCFRCPAGKFSGSAKAQSCTLCEPGMYSTKADKGLPCNRCPRGSMSGPGATECDGHNGNRLTFQTSTVPPSIKRAAAARAAHEEHKHKHEAHTLLDRRKKTDSKLLLAAHERAHKKLSLQQLTLVGKISASQRSVTPAAATVSADDDDLPTGSSRNIRPRSSQAHLAARVRSGRTPTPVPNGVRLLTLSPTPIPPTPPSHSPTPFAARIFFPTLSPTPVPTAYPSIAPTPRRTRPPSTHRAVLACPAGKFSVDWSAKNVLLELNRLKALGIDASKTRGCAITGPHNHCCLPCRAGRFKPKRSHLPCPACPAGKFNDVLGSKNCERCSAGQFAPGQGNTFCKRCASGTFQPEQGAGSCKMCAKGAFAKAEGSPFCLKCADGLTTVSIGQSHCIPAAQEETREPPEAPPPPAWQGTNWGSGVASGSTIHSRDANEVCNVGSVRGALPVGGRQHTGYISVGHKRRLFYWLIESGRSPRSDPLILRLNSLGCSAIAELVSASGPCSIDKRAQPWGTVPNKFAWTRRANMLYLDQPAPTGFSIGVAPHDEKSVVFDVLTFLRKFYKHHPMFVPNDLYIFSTGVGGRIAPLVARLLLEQHSSINLRGIAVGASLIAPATQFSSMPDFLEDNTYAKHLLTLAQIRNMRDDVQVCLNSIHRCRKMPVICKRTLKICLRATTSPEQLHDKLHDIRGELPQTHSKVMKKFLRNAAVAKSLGVLPTRAARWVPCLSTHVINNWEAAYLSNTAPVVANLLENGLRVLVYVGDADYVTNYKGTQRWVERLSFGGQRRFARAPLRTWDADSGQSLGLVKTAAGLTYVKVFRAGHMVGEDAPMAVQQMVFKWLSNEGVFKFTASSDATIGVANDADDDDVLQ